MATKLKTNDHEQRLEQRRKVCPPRYTKFKLHAFPQFLSKACVKLAKECGQYDRQLSISYFRQSFVQKYVGYTWDHWGTGIWHDGRECFVMQPYGISGDSLKAVEAFAEALGLDCLVDPASQWNPGYTFSVILMQKNR